MTSIRFRYAYGRVQASRVIDIEQLVRMNQRQYSPFVSTMYIQSSPPILSARESHHLIGTQAAVRNAAHSADAFLDLSPLAHLRSNRHAIGGLFEDDLRVGKQAELQSEPLRNGDLPLAGYLHGMSITSRILTGRAHLLVPIGPCQPRRSWPTRRRAGPKQPAPWMKGFSWMIISGERPHRFEQLAHRHRPYPLVHRKAMIAGMNDVDTLEPQRVEGCNHRAGHSR